MLPARPSRSARKKKLGLLEETQKWHAWQSSREARAASAPPSRKPLKAAGYKVAAVYAGNDEAADRSSRRETGIPVYKWDVSSYDACVAGLKQVAADLGPVEVLVNNAGITRDTMFPPHGARAVDGGVINTNLELAVQHGAARDRRHAASASSAASINISSINGAEGADGADRTTFGRQGR